MYKIQKPTSRVIFMNNLPYKNMNSKNSKL